MDGGKQNERGQMMRRAVGMAGRQTKPAEQALQADTASRLFVRLRPQNKRPTVGRWCSKKQPLPGDVLPLAMQVSGGSAAVLATMKVGSDLPTLSLPHLTSCSASLSSPNTPSPYVPFPEGNEGGLTSCTEAQLEPLDGLLVIQRSF